MTIKSNLRHSVNHHNIPFQFNNYTFIPRIIDMYVRCHGPVPVWLNELDLIPAMNIMCLAMRRGHSIEEMLLAPR